MAVVNLTPPVVQEILKGLGKTFEKRTNEQRMRIEGTHAVIEKIYRCIVSEEDEKKANELNKSMVNHAVAIHYTFKKRNFSVTLTTSRPLPGTYESSYNRVEIKTMSAEMIALHTAVDKELTTIEREKDKLEVEVNSIIAKCSNLKQLVTVWPSALELVSPQTKERHNRVVERFKPERVEVSDETKVALVKVRMT